MLKSLRSFFGSVIFWLGWPLYYVYLYKTQRTRLVIISGNKVLFVQNVFGARKLTLPGGGVHQNEDPAQAAAREVREETGLDFKAETLVPIKLNHPVKETGFRYYVNSFSVSVPQPLNPRAQVSEILSANWLEWREQLSSGRVSKTTADILQAWSNTEHLLD